MAAQETRGVHRVQQRRSVRRGYAAFLSEDLKTVPRAERRDESGEEREAMGGADG